MDAAEQIAREVESWEGVTLHRHRFDGVEFRVGRRELGHLHGDRLADLPFPKRVAEELITDGRARLHQFLPDSGWVSRPIAGDDDVAEVVALFRISYDRAVAAAGRAK